MTLYKDKYRIESARLQNWDYSTPSYYFVTLCTYNRANFFGDIVNGELRHSPAGEIVAEEWIKTESIRPNIKMDAWVVMPNHVHSIIIITHRLVETARRAVSTCDISPKSRLKPNTLGSIVGQIKIQCTKRIRAAGIPEFDWQERFWDTILWDEKTLANVQLYIQNNPAQWDQDREKPPDLWM